MNADLFVKTDAFKALGCDCARRSGVCVGTGEGELGCAAHLAISCPNFVACLNTVGANTRCRGAHAEAPVWKRIIDLACIVIALPALLPLMFFLGLLIKLVSPGPVFFTQERVGFKGKRFGCLKFRTMKVNAESDTHQLHLRDLIHSDRPMTKMDAMGDPRLIPFARFLRSTGLDELPQLINVLRGEMSLVGPRPCLPYEYEAFLPWHRERLQTLPGLTGVWQVCGKNRTTFTEMMHLDLFYVRNKSPRLDLIVMWRTVSTLLTQVRETCGKQREIQRQKLAGALN